MKEFTEENKTIMHEIGHFLLFLLYLSKKRGFGKKMFTDEFIEISIIKNSYSLGHISITKDEKKLLRKSRLCGGFVLLSGVLFALQLVKSDNKNKREFTTKREIKDNFVYVYCDNGGGLDLLKLLKNTWFGTSYTASHIYELKNIINEMWDNEVIRKISRSLFRELQKNKVLNNETCYSIIKPYIPELKKMGKKIYSIKTKLKINAKTILF